VRELDYSYRLYNLLPLTEYEVKVEAIGTDGSVLEVRTVNFKTSDEPTGEVIHFADINLEQAIKDQIGIERDIYQSDLDKLTHLYISNVGVQDLTGIEKAQNLLYLYIDKNNINDLSPLSELQNLLQLVVDDNPVTDGSVIGELTTLEYLFLRKVNISDYSFISNLSNLYLLGLEDNHIGNIDFLSGLKSIEYLTLEHNEITNVDSLKTLSNLRMLYLSNNPIQDLAPLSAITTLEDIYLDYTMVEDISILEELVNLYHVSLKNITTLDLSEGSIALNTIKKLEERDVSVDYYNPNVTVNLMDVTNVTSQSITISLQPVQEDLEYYLYINGSLVDDYDSTITKYEFTDLQPNRGYLIELEAYNNKTGEFLFDYAKVWTLEDGQEVTYQEVHLLLEDEEGNVVSNREFSIQGIDETNQDIFKYGYTNEIGEFIDESSTNLTNIFDLPVGQYEVYVYDPEGENDFIFTIYVEEGLDYISAPIVITVPSEEQPAGEEVTFADENLEQVIRDTLGIYDRVITTEDLKDLTYLHASYQDINDLTGLEFAVNLQYLDLAHNNIQDISPLEGLTSLDSLTLWDNNIENVEPLRNLTNLTYLDLDTNLITDISALVNLTNLETLWLTSNNIEDIQVVSSFTNLKNLYVWNVPLNEDSEDLLKTLIANGVWVDYDGFEPIETYLDIREIKHETIEVEWYTTLDQDLINHVEFYLNNEKVGEGNIEQSIYTFEGLNPNTDYELAVVIYDINGNEYWSYNYAMTEIAPEQLVEVKFQAIDEEDQALSNFDFYLEGLDEQNSNVYMYGYTNNEGFFRDWYNPTTTLSIPVGTYEVIIYGQGQYEDQVVEIEISKDEDYVNNPIQIVLDKVEKETTPLTLVIEDEQGNPITNIEYISLYSHKAQQTFGYEEGFHYLWNITDENGEITFDEVAVADDWELYINVPGYKIYNESITFNSNENNLVVTLETGAVIHGSVTTDDNRVLEGANYYVYGNQSYAYGTVTNSGELNIGGLYEEELTLEISMPGYKTFKTVIYPEDFVNGVANISTVQLEHEKYVHGYVTKDGEPQSDVYVYLYEDEDTWNYYWARTDSNGYFKIRNVEDGTYTLKTEGYNLPSEVVESITPSEELQNIVLEEKGKSSFEGEGNKFAASTQMAIPGKQIEYVFQYQNNGNAAANDVEVSFNLPEGVTLIEESLLVNGEQATLKGGAVQLGEVEVSEKGKIAFKAQISESYQQETIVSTATITSGNEDKTYSAPANVLFVTLQAPEKTAKADVKVYGTAKAGSTVKVFDGDKLLAETTVNGRWWYADVALPVVAGESSTHELVAKVENGTELVVSQPVTITYEPSIPTLTDVTVTAGWNGDVKLNPYTGLATFAIVEYTPIDVKVAFDQEIDEGAIYFLGEKYPLSKNGDQYVAQIPGTWSSYGEQLLEIGFVKDGHEVRLPLMEVIVLIDPSGYVFEGSMDNRLEGVTAVVEQSMEDGKWKQWNAEFYGQVNPQVTDEEGRYGWDVIQGDWRVVFSKEGYETYTSRTVTVPPAETQLNVPLVRISNPSVVSITPEDGTTGTELQPEVKVEFDRLMNIQNIEDYIRVIKLSDNSVVEGNITFEKVYKGYKETPGKPGYFEEDPTKELAKVFIWTPSVELDPNTEYRIEINAEITDYDGKVLGEQVTSTFTTAEQQNNDNDSGSENETGIDGENDSTSDSDGNTGTDEGNDTTTGSEGDTDDQKDQDASDSDKPSDTEDESKSNDKSKQNNKGSNNQSISEEKTKTNTENEVFKTTDDAVEKVKDGGTLDIDLNLIIDTINVELTSQQLHELKEKNATININSQGVDLHVPASIFEDTTRDVTITIDKLEKVKNALSDVYDFTIYEGEKVISQFSEPVTLVFTVDQDKVNNPENVKVFYWNEDKEIWEKVGGTYKDGVVTAKTDHFSIYTVFETTQQQLSGDTIEPEEKEGNLPNTATYNYNWILVGFALLTVGATIFFIQRRRRA